ncbi:SCO3242 family prenyltransferase [Micromonospora sp. KC723]|uniref:SCO3242 family prenyltransferase n=1 Tax=Micromonospora sp. KC723 TaxID=2530381 RepID=UPI0010442A20|nr:UbiA family prenyltransferase [Micromonospora sp. KC723]TDB72247.1 4-hydroxybenzoate polyprenyltransferase [Micromonospora sp. KC723]
MMRLRALAELVRAPAALSVPGDVVAGAAATGVLDRRTGGLAGASVCLYWAGMAANDWADRELDAVERPERPIPSGRVPAPVALGVAAGLTAAGLAISGAVGGRRALAVASPLAAAVWAYDLWAKNTVAGPLAMAACRALDVLHGASTGRLVRAVPAALAVGAHTYTVTALSRGEVSGTQPRVAAATLATTVAVAAAVARPDAAAPAGAATSVARLLTVDYARRYGQAQAGVLGDPAPPRVRAVVGAGITALPALQGALIARTGAIRAGLAVAAAAPLGRALARWISPT